MKTYAVDVESFLIGPGLLAPALVCVSIAHRPSPGAEYVTALLDHIEGIAAVEEILDAVIKGEARIALHNGVYDFGVIVAEAPRLLEKVFQVYAIGGVIDTKERQKLIDLADGEMKFQIDADGNFVAQAYTLAALAFRHLGWRLDKSEDSFRLRYGTLRGTPIALWPPDAQKYASMDAAATLLVSETQDRTENPVVVHTYVTDEAHQLRAAWALHLQSLWGFRTDAGAVDKLRNALEKERKKLRRLLEGTPYFESYTPKRGKNAGVTKVTKKTRAIQLRVLEGFRNLNRPPPLTDKGVELLQEMEADHPDALGEDLVKYVQVDKEALEDAALGLTPMEAPEAEGKRDLEVLAAMQYGSKLLTSYIPRLENGARFPLRANYNLLLETGRTSCPKPRENDDGSAFNIQVVPRKPGTRECIRAREGYLICSVDYSQLELCSWAQVLHDLQLGDNAVMEAINAGKDLHILTGAEIRTGRDNARITYEELFAIYSDGKHGEYEKTCTFGCKHEREAHQEDPDTKERRCTVKGCRCLKFTDVYVDAADMRQCAKPANFGYPGMMGPQTFTTYARQNYGIRVDVETANSWREAWRRAFPIYRPYFNWITSVVESTGMITQLRSGRIRGGISAPQGSNTLFQALAADGAKDATWELARAAYTQPSSPFYGSRPWAFVHDENLADVPEWCAHEAGLEMSRISVKTMKRWIPDVKIEAEPALMRHWSKKADTAYIDGRLVAWEDYKEWKKQAQAA